MRFLSRKFSQPLLAALLCFAATSTVRAYVYSNPGDNAAELAVAGSWSTPKDGGSNVTASVGTVTNLTVRVNRAGTGIASSAVLLFRLPQLGAVANPFTTASLTVTLDGGGTYTGGNIDIYGLGARPDATVVATDFYLGSTGGDATDATLIQADFVTGSSPGTTFANGQKLVLSGASLASYLNAQYAAGANAGKYVVIRFSSDAMDASTAAGVAFALRSANYGGDSVPALSYTLPAYPSATYHVNPATGTDSYSTLSAGHTFATIAQAVSAARNGDTLVLSGGTHAVAASIGVGKKLTLQGAGLSAPVPTVVAATYDDAPAGNTLGNAVFDLNVGAQGTAISGIVFTGNARKAGTAVSATGTAGVVVDDCEFYDFYGAGVYLRLVSTPRVSNGYFADCSNETTAGSYGMLMIDSATGGQFYALDFYSDPLGLLGSSGYGVKAIGNLTDCVFHHLNFDLKMKQAWYSSSTPNFAMELHGSGKMDGVEIRDCTSKNTFSLMTTGSDPIASPYSVWFHRNTIEPKDWYAVEAGMPHTVIEHNWSKRGAFLRNWNTNGTKNFRVNHNLVENQTHQFIKLTGGTDDVRIYNNTVSYIASPETQAFIYLDDAAGTPTPTTKFGSQNWQVHNNLIIGPTGGSVPLFIVAGNMTLPTPFTAYKNWVQNGTYPAGPDYGTTPPKSGDPLLELTGEKQTPYYQPKYTSLLRDAGEPVAGSAYTGAAPDIGAFEFGDYNRAPNPLLEYYFDETGATASSSPTSAITAAATLRNGTTATDYHVANAGPQGAGDSAFQSGTGAMGSGSRNAIVPATSVTALNSLSTFTVTGWLKTNPTHQLGGGAVLFSRGSKLNVSSQGTKSFKGGLNLYVNDTQVGTAKDYIPETDSWVFFAVTYDGTGTTNNVRFYRGTPTAYAGNEVVRSLNKGPVSAAGLDLFIGNNSNLNRAFGGKVDNIAIYSGALSQEMIEFIRAKDAP